MKLVGLILSEIKHLGVGGEGELILQKQRIQWWLPVAEKREKWGGVGQRTQTSHFKKKKFCGSNIQFGDTS